MHWIASLLPNSWTSETSQFRILWQPWIWSTRCHRHSLQGQAQSSCARWWWTVHLRASCMELCISKSYKWFSYLSINLNVRREWVGQPLVDHRHNSSTIDADFLPRRLSHVEMLARGVAPPAIVTGEGKIWRAEVSGRDSHRRSLHAPLGVCLVVAHNLVALTARSPVIEQSRA